MKFSKSSLSKAILVISILISFFSCEKGPINGKLDGRWQMMSVEYHQKDSIAYPSYTYLDFYLHLMQFKYKLAPKEGLSTHYGRFVHTGDSLSFRMIQCTKVDAAKFGMADTIQHFEVETLTHKRMVLNSSYSKIIFRKF